MALYHGRRTYVLATPNHDEFSNSVVPPQRVSISDHANTTYPRTPTSVDKHSRGKTRLLDMSVSSDASFTNDGPNECTPNVTNWKSADRGNDWTLSSPQLSFMDERDATHWSVQRVCEWLGAEGLDEHVLAFRQNGIDGSLLFELDESMLRDDLGVSSRLECRKILNRRCRLAPIAIHDLTSTIVQPTSALDTSFSARPTSQLGLVVSADELRRLHAYDPHDNACEVLQLDLRLGMFGLEEARELVDFLELVSK